MESFAFLYKMTCIEVIKQTQYLLKDVLRKELKRLFLKGKETYEHPGQTSSDHGGTCCSQIDLFVHLTVSRVQI